MNSYFLNTEYNRYRYPSVELIAIAFKSNKGKFIIDHTLTINLIKEKELSSTVYINTNEIHFARGNRVVTRGVVKIDFYDFSLNFGVVNIDTESEIIGILGAPFLDIIFSTDYFNNWALDYEILQLRRERTAQQIFQTCISFLTPRCFSRK